MFDMPAEASTSRVFGIAGDAGVETDLTGRAVTRRSIAPRQQVINVTVEAMDVADFERRTGYIGRVVAKSLLTGGSQLADNVAWAAGW